MFVPARILRGQPLHGPCLSSILKNQWQVVDFKLADSMAPHMGVAILQQILLRDARAIHNVASKLTFKGLSANFRY